MKKMICGLVAGLVLGFSSVAFAQGDISQTEAVPDVASWKLSVVKFNVESATEKNCVVVYRKVDGNGDRVGKKKVVVAFKNMADDPATPADETSTELTQLIQAINAGSNIQATIKAAVKTKLGLP